MKPRSIALPLVLLGAWMALWGTRGGSVGPSVLLHWPLAAILLFGYAQDLRGGLVAAGSAAAVLVGFRLVGVVSDWTLVAWQSLVFGVFGLYPFKFMQVREQRHHHYRTLIEYKRGELEALKVRLADLDRQCRELEGRAAAGGARGPARPGGSG